MQDKAQAQSQSANIAAYPQFCGSWLNDEWPEDDLIDQQGCFAELCAGLHVEHWGAIEGGNMKLQRNYNPAKSSVPK